MNKKKQIAVTRQSLFNVENEMWREYEDDYRRIIKQKEQLRIPFSHRSPQIFYRKLVIDHLKDYSAKKEMSHSCLHLAVYLFDVFMDNHSILPERLLLVANVCLSLAAKFEEINTNIPKLQELNDSVDNRYTISDYKMVEIIILKFFHWYLMIPTPAHYIHYFMQVILESEDLFNQKERYHTLMFELHEHIRIFLDKIVDDVHFMQVFQPSKLAAAVISGARIQMGLASWTSSLEKLTGYSKDQIYEATKALLQEENITCINCSKEVD